MKTVLRFCLIVLVMSATSCASRLEGQRTLLKNHLPEAEAGHAHDQYMLGLIYYTGHPKLRNPAEAAKWLRKAALQGDEMAATFYGCYLLDEGGDTNAVEGFKWVEKAAIKNVPEAQELLASCYDEGVGVKADRGKAIEWYAKAQALGQKDVGKRLAALLAGAP